MIGKIIRLGIVLGLALVSGACGKDDAHGDAVVRVTVKSADGALVVGETVKMYDEAANKLYEQNNLTPPTSSQVTDANGVATFTFSESVWFAAQESRQPTFAVQHGAGQNVSIWAMSRTIQPGSRLKLTIVLKNPEI